MAAARRPLMATTTRPPLAERVLSERVRAVPPSGIRRFFDIAATMDDVISLGVGEPDFDTPRVIVEAGVESLREGRTHYTSQLRHGRAAPRAVAPPRRPLRRPLRPGDRAPGHRRCLGGGRPRPARDMRPGRRGHPPRAVVRRLRARRSSSPAASSRHVATRFEDDFALDPAAVEAAITPRTKALFLGYPCNPTGAVLPDDVQDALADIAVRHDLLVVQRRDLRPARLRRRYRHRAMSALPGMRERTILMGGFSKAYAMTGWRVGYVGGAGGRSSRGWSRSTSTGSCRPRRRPRTRRWPRSSRASRTSQRMLAEYDRRRRLIVDGLNALGLETFEPRGAFYAFPRIGSTGLDDETFAERLLVEEHVAVVPGSAFGPSGAGHVRMCYATSYERLEEALRPDRAVRRSDRRSAARMTPTAGCSNGTRPSSASRSTASCGPRRRCSAAARPTYDGAPPNTPRLPGLPRPPGRAADDQPAGRRARPRDRRGDRGDRPAGDPLGPQELLLPGPAEGLPDQPVRPAARLARAADVRHVGRPVHRGDHPRPSRGGHRQARPRRPTPTGRKVEPGRLQPVRARR